MLSLKHVKTITYEKFVGGGGGGGKHSVLWEIQK